MNELQRTTWIAAGALSAALLLVSICIFRVSNATALVVVVDTAILGFVSLVTTSRLRYLVLLVLIGGLALELFVHSSTSRCSSGSPSPGCWSLTSRRC
jgi:hypothetical protein